MEYFQSVPWCAVLLRKPGTILYTPTCRLEPDANRVLLTQDQFFRVNLRSSDLIPHAVGFYQDPFAETTSSFPTSSGPRLLIHSSTLMLDLRPGTNGFSGSAHGGLISTLIDEAMGSLVYINHKLYTEMPSNVLNMHGVAMFTASMDVRFLKPLETPQIVLVTASLKNIQGRKVYFDVEVRNEKGVRYASCEGMWMSVSKEKL
ncbi:Thioesterase/thiol ester dehydrase-isomerase [Corynespora cassiicola Philippines]|uniref:Thioesterase/thiol ester dehydrase-isomerase n=1 Tax=Corynespora cassiicola Philippines TaxID=1448308 RepID=A0A2T2N1P0_CORCC|nr:Thioesterase/thiol ester dehydrase-isomerase [Corynespora cassiicola Philippines]